MRLLKLLALSVFLAAAAHAQIVVQQDVSYLTPDRTEKLDIYFPQKDHPKPLPAILLIHGGGWSTGDKADNRGRKISNDLATAGYIVFAINYKLSEKPEGATHTIAPWPQNIYDCKSALRFIRLHAKQLGVDPTHIAVMGESAGGHLSLLVGATANDAKLNSGGLYTNQSNEVSCIIDMYGVPDLNELAKVRTWVTPYFAGAHDAETADNMRIASPATYFSSQTPPILILHGTDDATVPYDVSVNLDKELTQRNIPHEFVTVPSGIHSFNLEPKQMDLRPVVIAFLHKYLGDPLAK